MPHFHHCLSLAFITFHKVNIHHQKKKTLEMNHTTPLLVESKPNVHNGFNAPFAIANANCHLQHIK
jgi:hypothetical protein